MPINHQKIADLREQKMLTMEEAAKRAGMATRQRWYAVESGQRANVTPDTLHAVARALGVTMDELMVQNSRTEPPGPRRKRRAARKSGRHSSGPDRQGYGT
jgi:transcriptional regulator with XRE-family HTH domain